MDTNQGIIEIRLEDIIPNRFQPRLNFDDKALTELSESIKQHGIIQPLVLRQAGEKYEIIAGERRYKAAEMAGLTKVPAVIANIDDNTSAEVALVENIQRKNLTAIEEAKSFKNLLDKGYLTQDELAKKMGLSQSAVSNKLRLLNLDEEVQDALLQEKISERHARALLQLENPDSQKNWLHKIIKERMTVRQLDLELKKIKVGAPEEMLDVPLVNLTPNVDDIRNNTTDINIQKESITQNEFGELPEALEEANEPALVTTPPRKFFNFLEDEAANMNISEAEPLKGVFEMEPDSIQPSNVEVILELEEKIEVLDMPMPSLLSEVKESSPVIDIFANQEQPPSMDSLSPFDIADQDTIEPLVGVEETVNIDKIIEMPTQTIVDPVSMIDKLDPQYESRLLEAAGLDLKSAINTVRDSIKNLEEKGFIVDTEEVDMERNYQITITIDKDGF